jgi:flagellar protein FliO/FliZ
MSGVIAKTLAARAGWLLAGWLPAAAWPALALAEETAAAAVPLPGEDFGAALAKMLLALALVLALLGGLWWLARRFLPAQAGGPSGGMRVLGRLPLGPRKGLILVEVAGRVLVLGMSEQGLNLLTTLDDPEEVAGLSAAGRGGFGRALKKAQNTQAPGAQAPGQAQSGPEARS